MFASRKHIPRRTFLRGAGGTLALPLLESMVPALTPARLTAAAPVRRFVGIWHPHGASPGYWSPLQDGKDFEFSYITKPLEPFRNRVVLISGLDMPEANRLTVHIMAAFAEYEREKISQRTKDALHVAKQRGTKLGSPEPKKGAAIRAQVLQAKADRFAANVLPVIHGLQAQGITSYKALARALNMRGIKTANNRQWYGSTVKNVVQRAER